MFTRIYPHTGIFFWWILLNEKWEIISLADVHVGIRIRERKQIHYSYWQHRDRWLIFNVQWNENWLESNLEFFYFLIDHTPIHYENRCYKNSQTLKIPISWFVSYSHTQTELITELLGRRKINQQAPKALKIAFLHHGLHIAKHSIKYNTIPTHFRHRRSKRSFVEVKFRVIKGW